MKTLSLGSKFLKTFCYCLWLFSLMWPVKTQLNLNNKIWWSNLTNLSPIFIFSPYLDTFLQSSGTKLLEIWYFSSKKNTFNLKGNFDQRPSFKGLFERKDACLYTALFLWEIHCVHTNGLCTMHKRQFQTLALIGEIIHIHHEDGRGRLIAIQTLQSA